MFIGAAEREDSNISMNTEYRLQRARDVVKIVLDLNVKLNVNQCNILAEKLLETLTNVEKTVSIVDGQYVQHVLQELYIVAQKVEMLIQDCSYDEERDWIISSIVAATKVADSKNVRFLSCLVELEWCSLLTRFIAASSRDREALRQQWEDFLHFEGNLKSIYGKDSKWVAATSDDRQSIIDKLRQSMEVPGEHRYICECLLLRLGEEVREVEGTTENIPQVTSQKMIYISNMVCVEEVTWKGHVFAEKKFTPNNVQNFEIEKEMMRNFSHPHILTMICSYEKDEWGHIMMEKMEMDLWTFIKERKERGNLLKPLEAVDIILQFAEGMLYLHSTDLRFKAVAHRDIKPQNVLINTDPVLVVKVADFGASKIKSADVSSLSIQTPNIGTTIFRAPELSPGKPLKKSRSKLRWLPSGKSTSIQDEAPETNPVLLANSIKADVFSFALTCSVLLTGNMPYIGSNHNDLTALKLQGLRPNLPNSYPLPLLDLLKKCWDNKPSERPLFSDVCKRLRKLKAELLIGNAPATETVVSIPRGPESSESPSFGEKQEVTRILVIGKSGSAKSSIIDGICGVQESHENERLSTDSRLCLHDTGGLEIKGQITATGKLLSERNGVWTTKCVLTNWYTNLHPWHRVESQVDPFQSNNRVHMLWLVCSVTDPPSFEWAKILKLCKYVPMQILVTLNEHEDPDYYTNFHYRKEYFFPQAGSEEELMKRIQKVKIGEFQDIGLHTRLWESCQAVQLRGEIEFAATIISSIREELGPSGITIIKSHALTYSREYSLTKSADFVLDLFCKRWSVPGAFSRMLKAKVISMEPISKTVEKRVAFEIRSGAEFVLFCVRCTSCILYIRGLRLHGWLSSVPTTPYQTWNTKVVYDFFNSQLEDLDHIRATQPWLLDAKILGNKSQLQGRLRTFLQHIVDRGCSYGQILQLHSSSSSLSPVSVHLSHPTSSSSSLAPPISVPHHEPSASSSSSSLPPVKLKAD